MGLVAEDLERLRQMDVCLLLGVSRMSLLEWERDGLPRNEDKSYRWAEVWEWVRERWSRAKRAEEEEGERDDDEDMVRWRKARADLAEIEVAKKRGELVPTAEVTAEVGRLLVEFKGNLLALPQRLAPRLARREPRAVADELERAIRSVLERGSTKWMGGQEKTKRPKGRKAKAKAKAKGRKRS